MNPELVNDIFQWDVHNWSNSLKLWEKYLQKTETKFAAAFGEGKGGLSLWLLCNDFHVECSDIKDLNNARELHTKYNFKEKINYSNQNITKINFDDNTFDVVIFKSVIGSLGKKKLQEKAFEEFYRILKPNGVLLFAENIKGTNFHSFCRKKFRKWAKNWRYPELNEFDEMLKKFNFIEKKAYGFISLFGKKESQRIYLSKIDKSINFMIPKSWRYILFAACIK